MFITPKDNGMRTPNNGPRRWWLYAVRARRVRKQTARTTQTRRPVFGRGLWPSILFVSRVDSGGGSGGGGHWYRARSIPLATSLCHRRRSQWRRKRVALPPPSSVYRFSSDARESNSCAWATSSLPPISQDQTATHAPWKWKTPLPISRMVNTSHYRLCFLPGQECPLDAHLLPRPFIILSDFCKGSNVTTVSFPFLKPWRPFPSFRRRENVSFLTWYYYYYYFNLVFCFWPHFDYIRIRSIQARLHGPILY